MKFKHLLFIVAATVSASTSILLDVPERAHNSFIKADISHNNSYTPQSITYQLGTEDLLDKSVLQSTISVDANIVQIKCMNSCDYYSHNEMHYSGLERNTFFNDNLSDPWALAYLGLC